MSPCRSHGRLHPTGAETAWRAWQVRRATLPTRARSLVRSQVRPWPLGYAESRAWSSGPGVPGESGELVTGRTFRTPRDEASTSTAEGWSRREPGSGDSGELGGLWAGASRYRRARIGKRVPLAQYEVQLEPPCPVPRSGLCTSRAPYALDLSYAPAAENMTGLSSAGVMLWSDIRWECCRNTLRSRAENRSDRLRRPSARWLPCRGRARAGGGEDQRDQGSGISPARVCLLDHRARFVGRHPDGGGFAIFETVRRSGRTDLPGGCPPSSSASRASRSRRSASSSSA